ncbi:hypothetical protein M501DRAFT_995249 [Patellaria atrata CBS 101060]|uniref:IgE-binding protein n=1 Tax=Patellaria atrata CBS 101060 TaxID=1346257 RepID=A0A9P4S8Q1_9PEZI|nr:hypothetical protein M501DRAFT_995249 [Patellaria atrata CBS 101060]
MSFLLSLAFASLLQSAVTYTVPLSIRQDANNTLPNINTVTAYAPGSCLYNGLKVQGGGILAFGERVYGYCPESVRQQGGCPNGTQTAWYGAMRPSSLVPGGQDTFVHADGLISITVQHSHSIPHDAYWGYQGFAWTALPVNQEPFIDCPTDNPKYNCEPPTGFINWRLATGDSTKGGIMVCENPYNSNSTALYAVTPAFNKTGCVELVGLGTHNYTGPVPPVWAY